MLKIDEFIEDNSLLIYERISELNPEVIPNDDWYLEEHIDYVIEFVEKYMKEEYISYLNERKEN